MREPDPSTPNIRPSWLRACAPLLGTGVGVASMFVMLATASAARTELRAWSFEPATERLEELLGRAEEPSWTMPEATTTRIGYRRGRAHAIEVVPLGPDDIEVEARTAEAFLAMRAAAEDSGVELRLESGFRTDEKQAELYRAWRRGDGHPAARPGRSNHQSGRALDIPVRTVPGAGEWLEANAERFGFERTVRGEPWHWEYVELPRARGK